MEAATHCENGAQNLSPILVHMYTAFLKMFLYEANMSIGQRRSTYQLLSCPPSHCIFEDMFTVRINVVQDDEAGGAASAARCIERDSDVKKVELRDPNDWHD